MQAISMASKCQNGCRYNLCEQNTVHEYYVTAEMIINEKIKHDDITQANN